MTLVLFEQPKFMLKLVGFSITQTPAFLEQITLYECVFICLFNGKDVCVGVQLWFFLWSIPTSTFGLCFLGKQTLGFTLKFFFSEF